MDLVNFSKDLLDSILKIEEKSFNNPWNARMFLESAANKTAIFKALLKNKIVLGYYILSVVIDEAELVTIAVSPHFRRQNLGRFMFSDMLKEAESAKSKFISLETRKSNTPALNLYKSFGFKETGLRKNYYKDEDAVVLRLNLDR
ncbi:MAG: ribosomal protein S18-alanine N-acetyltransferase [Endomicrobium sp.]|jgi:ribosomal-protein-alanine N-acetyltransferase|nr:ribosomal protein S18-alanine N-acetyltransferase [Endomicrobium sp.]